MSTQTQIISFDNAVASLKENANPIDEAILRDTVVYAKLMLAKGVKADKKKVTIKDFLLSDKGTYIKAELFILNRNNSVVYDKRLFVNVDPTKSVIRKLNGMFFVELIHPTVNLAEATEVTL